MKKRIILKQSTSDKISNVYSLRATHPRRTISAVIRLYDDGWTFREIAERLKLASQNVAEIVTGHLKRTA